MAGTKTRHLRTRGGRVDAPPDGATGLTVGSFDSGPGDAPGDARVGAPGDAPADGSAGMPVTHLWRTSGRSGVRQILPKGRGSACLAQKVNRKKRTALRLLGIDTECPREEHRRRRKKRWVRRRTERRRHRTTTRIAHRRLHPVLDSAFTRLRGTAMIHS